MEMKRRKIKIKVQGQRQREMREALPRLERRLGSPLSTHCVQKIHSHFRGPETKRLMDFGGTESSQPAELGSACVASLIELSYRGTVYCILLHCIVSQRQGDPTLVSSTLLSVPT